MLIASESPQARWFQIERLRGGASRELEAEITGGRSLRNFLGCGALAPPSERNPIGVIAAHTSDIPPSIMPAYLSGPPRHRRELSRSSTRPSRAPPTAPPPVAAASSSATGAADPLADLATLYDKKLVVCGGFGTEATDVAQWRSMWAAFKQYGDGDDPPREELECARGCSYYCGDCHALTLADKTVRAARAILSAAAQFAAQSSDAVRRLARRGRSGTTSRLAPRPPRCSSEPAIR